MSLVRRILRYEIPPKLMQVIHLIVVVLIFPMYPIVLLTALKDSLEFLIWLSIFTAHYAAVCAWQESLGERRADKKDPYGD